MQKIGSVIRAVSALANLSKRNIGVLPSASQFSTFQNSTNKLLVPFNPAVSPVCGMKMKGIVRRRCKSCYFVVRDGRMFIMCPAQPRHKQAALRPKPHNTWVLTHASQSRVRPW